MTDAMLKSVLQGLIGSLEHCKGLDDDWADEASDKAAIGIHWKGRAQGYELSIGAIKSAFREELK